ncbi:hypothetical protein SAMN05216362_103157 [Piscibacillus halophilus]|uniref:Uncharacterized protein n=1 Tax=Piscibacillus halophilus TaxID=571933 RepID=A0A1H9B8M9_9BACI|nr:hypothetical protein SAMN05216362_103157 [Piscibacillus halophilus]
MVSMVVQFFDDNIDCYFVTDLFNKYLFNQQKVKFIIQELNLRDFEDRHVPDYDVIEKE